MATKFSSLKYCRISIMFVWVKYLWCIFHIWNGVSIQIYGISLPSMWLLLLLSIVLLQFLFSFRRGSVPGSLSLTTSIKVVQTSIQNICWNVESHVSFGWKYSCNLNSSYSALVTTFSVVPDANDILFDSKRLCVNMWFWLTNSILGDGFCIFQQWIFTNNKVKMQNEHEHVQWTHHSVKFFWRSQF